MTKSSVLKLTGETTLAETQRGAGFPLLLPAYPADLGPPDRVYRQDIGGPIVVLVWLEPGDPSRARLSLHLLGPGVEATKGPVNDEPVETNVGGYPALWMEGTHVMRFTRNGQVVDDFTRLVEGHVLLWWAQDLTFRLETNLPLADAVRIAGQGGALPAA